MFYEKHEDNNKIVLRPNILKLEDYDVEMSSSGDIVLKKRKKLVMVDDIDTIEFNFSKVLECSIDIQLELNYTAILKQVYKLIGDATKIIKTTSLNIVVGSKTDKGYTYMNDIGISFQRCDSNKTLKEIMTQCSKNKVHIALKIELDNKNIVHVSI
jgi:hypothetical protein